MKKILLIFILTAILVVSLALCASAIETTDGNIILGDVDGDGQVTNADVLMIYRYIYNSELYPLPTVCNHSYGDWIVEAYASCTNDGRMTRTCEKCSETEETTVKGGHLYVETVVPPTPADEGYTNHVCKLCGNSYKDNIFPALGFTSGLAYTKNADGKTCTITGLGTVTATSVVIPEEIDGYTVTVIGAKAFENEASITKIIIPNTVKTIGTCAFYGCTGITEITIPASVTDIGTQIFYKASNLATVYYNSSYSNTYNHFLNLAHIKKVVFGGSYVPSDILNGCKNITEVVISDSVKYIDSYAFLGCTSLAGITIPDSVTSIGDYAFYNCTSLKSVYITDIEAWLNISFSVSSSNPCYYGADLYLNGELLTSVEIPDSVTSIGDYAFYGCTSLESITIPDSVTSIGYYAFEGCYKLIEVINKSSLSITAGSSSYGYVAYYAKEVHNGSSKIVEKDGWVFYTYNNVNYFAGYKGNETEIILPDNYNGEKYEIYKYAFHSCTSLVSITIPDSVTSIGWDAFYGCTSLTSITIPDSVTSIGSSAFSGCTSLTSVTIGNSVTSIGYEAFYGCTSLKSVYITDIEAWLNISFSDYDSNPCYYGADLYLNGELLTSVEIPDSVTSIGSSAFSGCTSLESITIPDSVTSIGRYAFRGCSKLTSITFDDMSTWYRTTSSSYSGGTETSVKNPSTNATDFKSTYCHYYWYKK